MENKTQKIGFRINKENYEELKDKARKHHLSVGQYVRTLVALEDKQLVIYRTRQKEDYEIGDIYSKESNVKVIYHKLNNKEKIDAEPYVISFFRNLGFQVFFSKERGLKETLSHYVGIDYNQVYDELKRDKLGRPDLIAFKDKNLIFIEVKTGEDGFRNEQIKWACEHPHHQVILFYVMQGAKDV